MSLTTEQTEKIRSLLFSRSPEHINQVEVLIDSLLHTESEFRTLLEYMNIPPFSSVPTFDELKDCFSHMDNAEQNFYAIWTLSMLANRSEQVRIQTTTLVLESVKTNLETLWPFGVPSNIRHLKNLTYLHLCDVGLEKLPDSIGELTNLKALWLALNPLTVLPESICQLTNLVDLNCQWTKLTKLPNDIDNLTQLTILDLLDNPLAAEEWGRLKQALPSCRIG